MGSQWINPDHGFVNGRRHHEKLVVKNRLSDGTTRHSFEWLVSRADGSPPPPAMSLHGRVDLSLRTLELTKTNNVSAVAKAQQLWNAFARPTLTNLCRYRLPDGIFCLASGC